MRSWDSERHVLGGAARLAGHERRERARGLFRRRPRHTQPLQPQQQKRQRETDRFAQRRDGGRESHAASRRADCAELVALGTTRGGHAEQGTQLLEEASRRVWTTEAARGLSHPTVVGALSDLDEESEAAR